MRLQTKPAGEWGENGMKRWIGRMNLRNKLMFMLALFILVPLLLVGFAFYGQSSELVLERTDKETGQVLNLVQQNIDRLLRQMEGELLSLYDQDDLIGELSRLGNGPVPEGTGVQEGISLHLRNYLMGKEYIDSVYLISAGGAVHFADFKGPSSFLQMMDRHPEWKQAISMAGGRVVWFPAYTLPSTPFTASPRQYIPFGMQIRDVTDVLQPLGIVLLNMEIQALDDIIGDVAVSPNSVFLVTDPRGKVVWHRNAELYSADFFDVPFFREAARQCGAFTTQRLNGELYRIGCANSGYNDWLYFSFVPMQDLQAQSENLKRFFITTIVALTALFILLALLTTHYITNPLRRMAAAMRRIQRDNLGTRIQAQSFDEIGLLQSAFNIMQSRIDALITEVRNISEKEREAEVKALQAQINPHVLYNTLDTINWMAIERGQTDISSMITALGDIMRYAIRKNEKLVTLGEELKWAENYAYLQKMRFEDRFDIIFDVDPAILHLPVPRLFLQPYLENSIIHGMENKESGGWIRVSAGRDGEGRIRVSVEDNGSGIPESRLKAIREGSAHGVGITNLDERLKLEYGPGYGVTVDSIPDQGTTVVIVLPELPELENGRLEDEDAESVGR